MTDFGKDLIESLGEAVQYAKGRRAGARTHEVNVPDVKSLRRSLGLTQQVDNRGGGEPVVDRAALRAIRDQSALLQAREVPGDVRLRTAEHVDQVHDPALTAEQLGEDRETSRVAEAAEHVRCDRNVWLHGGSHQDNSLFIGMNRC